MKDFQRARKRRRILQGGAMFAALMIVAVTCSAWLYYKTPGNLLILTVQLRSYGIAEFGNRWARNNLGQEWQIFSDSKWGGKSTIWYEIVRHEKLDDFYISIHFVLGPSEQAYCGIYTEFSLMPPWSTSKKI
jgi:hypothetical protein